MKSMTGFASLHESFDFGDVHIEIQTVNSRYVETHTRLPSVLSSSELAIKQRLKSHLSRGKCECVIRLDKTQTQQTDINLTVLNQLLSAVKTVRDEHADLAMPSLGDLLSIQGVVTTQAADTTALTDVLFGLIDKAMLALIERRNEEGQHLTSLISSRLDLVENIVKDAREQYKIHREFIETQLRERVLALKVEVDEARFEQELVYLLQKSDIDEELDRLSGHVSAVRELIVKCEPVGRKLDFLMQELNREANTIGSKSHRIALTNNAIELKVLIEQIREQVQNVE